VKAMILAAGRGERMMPLTKDCPKPLLMLRGKPLIVWQIEKLITAGFKEIVINIAYLGEMIQKELGDGAKWGVKISYSDEQENALESAGGIIKALDLLTEKFMVINSDLWCDYRFMNDFDLKGKMAHLIMVPNPEHNKQGDFGLIGNDITLSCSERYTFSGIGYYSKELFFGLEQGRRKLGDVIREAIKNGFVSGELYEGIWRDIGTPERLKEIASI
jgi:N-acetyl-alpha-D-muramate 1-phosphate uridylyltransferase